MNGHSWRWWTIRLELAIATAAPLLVAFVAFFSPAWSYPIAVQNPIDPRQVITLGLVLSLAGAAWAWRIWLADLEAGTPAWRSRARR